MNESATQRLSKTLPLPAAIVDLDAFERNIDTLLHTAAQHGKRVRLATKSLRHTGLIRRVLDRGGDRLCGLMCYTAREAVWCATLGFDDLLVAYPTVQKDALSAVAASVQQGKTIRLVVDAPHHLNALEAAGQTAGVVLEAILEVDVSYRPVSSVHLGARRSPLREVGDLLALVKTAEALPHVRITGLMAYESQIAGLPDQTPFSKALNPMRKWLKSRSTPDVARRRQAAVKALTERNVQLDLVNGGGTGSVHRTGTDASVTEIAIGSGFLCPHLFDYYADLTLEPAAFFALEVARVPAPGLVTCLGGGYVASGEPGWDKVPRPWWPSGLSLLSMEAAGEVQTPLKVPSHISLNVGDAVWFRHAKAGELAERFTDFHLVRGGQVEAVEPTYRGEGQCFL